MHRPRPSTTYEATLQALRAWRDPHPDPALLTLFAPAERLLPSTSQPAPVSHPLHRLLELACDRLARHDPQAADLLRKRFQQGQTREALARDLNISLSGVDKRQARAVQALAETLQAMVHEAQSRGNEGHVFWRAALQARVDLAAAPTRLFGVDPYLADLHAKLDRPGPPYLVVIQGIGGIGKTALAAAYVRQALAAETFHRIAWTTARTRDLFLDGHIHPHSESVTTLEGILSDLLGQLLPLEAQPLPFTLAAARQALVQALFQGAHLLVIDNLETVAEIEDLMRFLASLQGTGAKFLLTSRHAPSAPTLHPVLRITELAQEDAARLLRYLGQTAGVTALAQASHGLVQAVYQVVGGNPLALRLFVGQCRLYPPEQVLAAFQAVQGRTVEQLYTFIYQQAWAGLSQDEQQLLLSMVAVPPQGAQADYIATLSGYSPTQTLDILERLVALSLVELRQGPDGGCYYTIHSLTRTFLRHQILQWPESFGLLP